ncbi:MAG: cell division protein FtsA [Myxococcales bacterium]|nr:cell division protein FtsA [Myxococcales bacterium]
MARKDRDQIIVGLDVGTHKVAAVVGEVKYDGSLEIIGVGTAPSMGIKKGVVVNVGETMEAIKRAVHEAELMAGITVNAVYVTISGNHLRSFNNKGAVTVATREVSEEDVVRVLDNANAVQIPADRQILHTVPQEFVVDENDGIKEPIGISGQRLQVNVHIMTALNASVQNVVQCAERCGLHVLKTTAELLASARAVLEADERELGVVHVDIGAGTTDIAIYHNGYIVHSAVLPMGGDHITSDIAVGMRTPKSEAERVKLAHGAAQTAMVSDDETIEVACVGARETVLRKRQLLCDIIEPRLEEIFRYIEREISASKFQDAIGSGLVLTGGTALLPGIAEFGEELLGLPVRIGVPKKVGAQFPPVASPIYAAAVGLVMQAAAEEAEMQRKSEAKLARGRGGTGVVGRFFSWVRDVV